MADQLMSASISGEASMLAAVNLLYNFVAPADGQADIFATPLQVAQASPFLSALAEGDSKAEAVLTAYDPNVPSGRRQSVKLGARITWEDNP